MKNCIIAVAYFALIAAVVLVALAGLYILYINV